MPTLTIIIAGYRALLEAPEQDKAVRFGVDIPLSMLDGATYYAEARKVSRAVTADRMVIEKGENDEQHKWRMRQQRKSPSGIRNRPMPEHERDKGRPEHGSRALQVRRVWEA